MQMHGRPSDASKPPTNPAESADNDPTAPKEVQVTHHNPTTTRSNPIGRRHHGETSRFLRSIAPKPTRTTNPPLRVTPMQLHMQRNHPPPHPKIPAPKSTRPTATTPSPTTHEHPPQHADFPTSPGNRSGECTDIVDPPAQRKAGPECESRGRRALPGLPVGTSQEVVGVGDDLGGEEAQAPDRGAIRITRPRPDQPARSAPSRGGSWPFVRHDGSSRTNVPDTRDVGGSGWGRSTMLEAGSTRSNRSSSRKSGSASGSRASNRAGALG